MAYSEAQNKATQRYIAKTYDIVSFRVKKGERNALRQSAIEAGYSSIPAYITALVNADRKRTVLSIRRESAAQHEE